MANNTEIAWTDVTVNPFPGCRKVSPGCANCYAERMAKRLKAMEHPAYQDVVDEHGWTGKVGCNLDAMRVPGKGKMVFVNSMGDLFYEGITDVQIAAAFGMMAAAAKHTFQVLTKRPERMREWNTTMNRSGGIGRYIRSDAGRKALRPLFENMKKTEVVDGRTYRRMDDPWMEVMNGAACNYGTAPIPNVWLGVTAENQEWADKRIPLLIQIPAAVRFVSLEPLLGPIDVRHGVPGWERCLACGRIHRMSGVGHASCDCMGFGGGRFGMQELFPLDSLDWVIVGCESGPNRRPCDTQWVADIVTQCRVAGVPVFVKQIDIDGEVVKDPDQIALELSDYVGRPLGAEDVRQWPRKETDRALLNKRNEDGRIGRP